MRIPCPYCGSRNDNEFVYRGDASPRRTETAEGMAEYIYLRDNPAGFIDEYWYHAQGCRNWVVVRRDTRTHAIENSVFARDWMS